MGRLQPSVGQPPASFRRAARAKRAKATLNTLIPSLLAAHPRARRGIDSAELILDPPRASSPASTSPTPPRITLRVTDTLRAARSLTSHHPRVALLNMASPLHPGGGFLTGASSQEESLCMRTTLLPSLSDAHYRLPDLGAIYTPDVLVFREGTSDDAPVMEKRDRWFVDVITAAMPRNPETKVDDDGFAAYADPKDRELVAAKMRMVMRVCRARGVGAVVLGAWGCGAYGNPVGEVARAWKRVLLPKSGKKKPETWEDMDIVFAIKDAGMAAAFAEAFGEGLEEEEADEDDEEEEEESEEGQEMVDLRMRIDELRVRVEKAPSPQLKQGLAAVLAGLEAQLPGNTT
ncbi:hypothetical protein B0T11DRAFT_281295 [Plectosphaerella cucumerina]|uniref:Microbial-type PARG catalytic domain-containing protein n=1 Tax=Plectosphaerella cucumerina TaxID=40658 RepID=A0A8K0X3H7_9PEZI|nr:hypothetical protein B0T11DRAFT_281295 [Plectosphaerella cucumerina]